MGISAGAKLTIILASGKSMPELIKAVLTLSLASSTDLLGNPIILNPGKPFLEMLISTSMGMVSKPKWAADRILVNTNIILLYNETK